MLCPNCGKEIADDSLYCEYCGERSSESVWWYFKSYGKIVLFTVCILFLGIGIGWYSTGNKVDRQENVVAYKDSLEWVFPIGSSTYSGYVAKDTDNGEVPHTIGVAKITNGEYAGSVYEGEFKMGKMEGRAKYTLSNGDVFVGEFKDNQYDKGKYIIASSGEYFEGTFKNGEPDKGNWYNKKGKKY